MMTNYEWGAVTYLSKSKYGHITMKFGIILTPNTSQVVLVLVLIHLPYLLVLVQSLDGVKASSTFNIYGIYDMSIGANNSNGKL